MTMIETKKPSFDVFDAAAASPRADDTVASLLNGPVLQEQEPGVYVRNRHPERVASGHDSLDFLWDNPKRQHADGQKNRLGYFFAGLATGSVVTLLICLAVLFLNQSMSQKPSVSMDMPNTPSIEAQIKGVAKATGQAVSTSVSQAVGPVSTNDTTLPPVHSAATTPATSSTVTSIAEVNAVQKYTIKKGDTLGAITGKYYEDSSPQMAAKLQAANHLKSATALQVGQVLVIPAKSQMVR